MENTKEAANEVWMKAKEFDQKHHIIDKTREASISAYQAVAEFEKKHNVIDNVAKTISQGASALAKALSKDRTNTASSKTRVAQPSVTPGVENISGPPLGADSPVESLMALGFERQAVLAALQQSNNNVETAASLLFGD